jgi:hypothetical protein
MISSSNTLILTSISPDYSYYATDPALQTWDKTPTPNSTYIEMLTKLLDARIEYIDHYYDRQGGQTYFGTGLALQHTGCIHYLSYFDSWGNRRHKKIHNNCHSYDNTTRISLLQGTNNPAEIKNSINDRFSPFYTVTGAADTTSNLQIRTIIAPTQPLTALYDAYHSLTTSSGKNIQGITLNYTKLKQINSILDTPPMDGVR